jgi:hypothetical protein
VKKQKAESRKQERDEGGNAETLKPEKLKSEAARAATRRIASGSPATDFTDRTDGQALGGVLVLGGPVTIS